MAHIDSLLQEMLLGGMMKLSSHRDRNFDYFPVFFSGETIENTAPPTPPLNSFPNSSNSPPHMMSCDTTQRPSNAMEISRSNPTTTSSNCDAIDSESIDGANDMMAPAIIEDISNYNIPQTTNSFQRDENVQNYLHQSNDDVYSNQYISPASSGMHPVHASANRHQQTNVLLPVNQLSREDYLKLERELKREPEANGY